MVAFLFYPFYLVSFWYKDVCLSLINFFTLLNRYTVSLLSLALLIKTFFKPLKNEYRDGLVVFSIIFGIFIKTFLLAISFFIVTIMLFIEVMIVFFVIILPIVLIIIVLGFDSPLWYAK